MNSTASQRYGWSGAARRVRTAVFGAPLVLLLLAAGCGLGGGGNNDAPPPGQMEVLSIVPVETAPPPPLIPASAFETWWAGAPAPASEAIVLPRKGAELSRAKGNAADGELAIRQTWTAKDSPWNPENFFGVQVDELKPHTQYKLTGAAYTEDDSSATLEVYGFTGADTDLWHMDLGWVQVNPAEGWQTFEGAFATGELTTVRITAACYTEASEENPNTVLWDNWQLTEVGPAEWPEVKPTEDNLIANGSFEIWVPGAPAPRGPFLAPHEGMDRSRVTPLLLAHPDGNVSLRQQWSESDREDAPTTLFGAQFMLDENTTYEFRMLAHMMQTGTVTLEAYGIDENNKVYTLAAPLIEVPAQNAWTKYSGQFDTGEYEKVRIVVRGPADAAAYPNKALFDAWQLVQTGE